jgi:hypothetical protein
MADSLVVLSLDYFQSLRDYAVPLNLKALGATWLAQRLVHPREAAFLTWAALKDPFGPHYGRMVDFKRKFRLGLRASFELDSRGITLRDLTTNPNPLSTMVYPANTMNVTTTAAIAPVTVGMPSMPTIIRVIMATMICSRI